MAVARTVRACVKYILESGPPCPDIHLAPWSTNIHWQPEAVTDPAHTVERSRSGNGHTDDHHPASITVPADPLHPSSKPLQNSGAPPRPLPAAVECSSSNWAATLISRLLPPPLTLTPSAALQRRGGKSYDITRDDIHKLLLDIIP